ncbi:hypothetical protein [Streptomyces sp. MMG1121]|uniref:hypothetical protein n=1 Tax=Streptomyces sp. MMG1121 TaxID=1415544 RepID=UPI0006AFD9CA|nr:hypothetical protein [Streptomyces sp. MMG1121]KOV70977.1 hypothetical protein ADK64_01015 [Streptomyces sp. MMG1121]
MRSRSLWTAAALALVSATGLTTSAHAVTYGTPTVKLSTAYLSGAVGSTADPVVDVTVAQSGADASALGVAASKTSESGVAGTGDVQVTGTGGIRTVAVTAHAQGYADLTLKVTGLGGETATTTLHYAASRVQLITDDGAADLYGDGTEAKDLSHPEWQKSRTTWFTLN